MRGSGELRLLFDHLFHLADLPILGFRFVLEAVYFVAQLLVLFNQGRIFVDKVFFDFSLDDFGSCLDFAD